MTDDMPRWDEVFALAVGDHLHLHELVGNPPEPGSRDWLPVLNQLIVYLLEQGGHWGISFRVGTTPEPPVDAPVTSENVYEYVDEEAASEPPAVYRMSEEAVLNTWEGESHSWTQLLGASVIEKVSFNRARSEPADEGYDVSVFYEIRALA